MPTCSRYSDEARLHTATQPRLNTDMILIPLAVFFYHTLEAIALDSVYEPDARIYNGAAPNNALTLLDPIVNELSRRRGCHARITAGDEPLHSSLRWDMSLWNLVTKKTISGDIGKVYTLSVGFFCSDGTFQTYDLDIQVTEQNQFTPRFDRDKLHLYVPVETVSGTPIAALKANDADTVSYNRHVSYKLTQNVDERYQLESDGRLFLKKEMTGVNIFGKHKLTATACDHGSPRLCTDIEIVVVPVTISAPSLVRVNVASEQYQIFEWRAPDYGNAKKYRIYLRSFVGQHVDNENPLYYAEIDAVAENILGGRHYRHMSRTPLSSRMQYSLIVSAVDQLGETPAEPVTVTVASSLPHTTVHNCSGQCHEAGGVPACFRRSDSHEEDFGQYNDHRLGPQCICFAGYVGSLCSHIAECAPSLRTYNIGPVSWPATQVNVTAALPCPYGPLGHTVTRQCRWNVHSTVPEWAPANRTDLERCRTKEALISTLAVMQTIFFQQPVPNYAAMEELLQTVENILPAAIQDPDIARAVLKVIATAQRASWHLIPLDTTDLRLGFRDVLVEYAHKATGNLQPTDIINTYDDIGVSTMRAEPGKRVFIGVHGEAFVEFRVEHQHPIEFAVVYSRNSTFYPSNDYPRTDNAVLELLPRQAVQIRNPNAEQSFSRVHGYTKPMRELEAPIRFGLRAPTVYSAQFNEPITDNPRIANFTCVYWDEEDNEWRTQGIFYIQRDMQTGLILCETYHLSAFSVLANYNDAKRHSIFANDKLVPPILLGCLLATCLLAFSLLATAVFRNLWRHHRAGIFTCTALTRILMYFMYSLGNGGIHEFSDWMCAAIGIIVQWCLLCTLLWLCIESANLYKVLRRAMSEQHESAPCALLRKAVVAWGLPTLIMTIQVTSSFNMTDLELAADEGVEQRCAPRPTLAFYLLPALILLLVDSSLFVAIFIRYSAVAKTLPHYYTFIRRESALNFALCILCTVSWGFELLTIGANSRAAESLFFGLTRTHAYMVVVSVFAGLIIAQELLVLVGRCACGVLNTPKRPAAESLRSSRDERAGTISAASGCVHASTLQKKSIKSSEHCAMDNGSASQYHQLNGSSTAHSSPSTQNSSDGHHENGVYRPLQLDANSMQHSVHSVQSRTFQQQQRLLLIRRDDQSALDYNTPLEYHRESDEDTVLNPQFHTTQGVAARHSLLV